jgi:uncharacterized protein
MNATPPIKPFLFPFREVSPRLMVIWFSVAILLILHLYEGNENFFLKHLANGMEEGPLLDWFKYLYKHICSLILFAVIPIMLMRFVLREPLADFGIALGDWRFGVKATLIAMVVMVGPVYIGSRNPEFRALYPLTTMANESWTLFALWGLSYIPHYIGWEVIFRGYIGMGLKKDYGAFQAMMITVIITTLLHIGKPEGETWSTIPAGIYMALLTYRTNSVVWAILFHFYVGMLNTAFGGLPL